MVRKVLLLLVGSTFLAACGSSKLPQYRGQISAMDVETEKTAPGPTIDVKNRAEGGDNAVAAIVDAASAAAGAASGIEIKNKFDDNFTDREIHDVVRRGVRDALDEGSPFRAADEGEEADSRIVVDIYQYGIEREENTPVFFADYVTSVYFTAGGEEVEVWSDTYECNQGGLFDFESKDADLAESTSFLTAVKNMSDEEFRRLVVSGFERCADNLVQRMREDAEEG